MYTHLWKQLSHAGVQANMTHRTERQLVFTNQIALFTVLGSLATLLSQVWLPPLALQWVVYYILALALATLVLNGAGGYKVGPMVLVAGFSLIFLIPAFFPSLNSLSHTSIFICQLPTIVVVNLLFHHKQHPVNYWALVGWLFALVATADLLALLQTGGLGEATLNGPYLGQIKPTLLISWGFLQIICYRYQRLQWARELQLNKVLNSMERQNLQLQEQQLLLEEQQQELEANLEELLTSQEEIAAREAEMTCLVHAMEENMIVSQFAPNGRIEKTSPALLKLLNTTAEEVIGRYHHDFDDWAHHKDAEKRAAYEHMWQELRTGRPFTGERHICLPHTELWLRSHYIPIANHEKQIRFIMAVGEDITAIKTHALEAEELTNQLLESTELLAIKNEELEGSKQAIADQNAELQAQQEELLSNQEMLRAQHERLQETQGQLVQSEKMAALGHLTAGIAHELNNPISHLHAGVEGLQDSLGHVMTLLDMYNGITAENLEEQQATIAHYKKANRLERRLTLLGKLPANMEVGTRRATEIVKELRTFSRLDEGDLKPTNVHEGLDSTLVLLNHKLKGTMAVHCHYGTLPIIEAYPGKLNQVFMNILTNAIQANEERMASSTEKITLAVTITTEYNKAKGQVCVSIADEGLGIPAEVMPHIFNPFFTTKPVGSGTGLGLSIAASIVEEHQGKISVNSQPGLGSCFTLTVPVQHVG